MVGYPLPSDHLISQAKAYVSQMRSPVEWETLDIVLIYLIMNCSISIINEGTNLSPDCKLSIIIFDTAYWFLDGEPTCMTSMFLIFQIVYIHYGLGAHLTQVVFI